MHALSMTLIGNSKTLPFYSPLKRGFITCKISLSKFPLSKGSKGDVPEEIRKAPALREPFYI